ncbi:hypothetical protein Ahy_B10g103740 isoform A [Arachis hypogaea]|uniref:Uncharacterized protein n=1 Tax=Arachis hypogaea TaxID=3818 RepID=A0A444X3W4_ARAHY|nr:hypothetical protein Ahy_B10g103740 isoform A [Arachis hypogaea]
MDRVFNILFHHGETFQKSVDRKVGYYPDNRSCLGDLELDRLDNEINLVACTWEEHGSGFEKGLIDVFIEHEVSSSELLQGKEVMIYVDDQVRDLGEQAKKNTTSVSRHCANPNAEKTPTCNVSWPSDQVPKALVTVPKEQQLKKKTKTVSKLTETNMTRRYCLRSVAQKVRKRCRIARYLKYCCPLMMTPPSLMRV